MATLNDIETKVQSIIDILHSRIVKTITGTLPLTFTAKAGNVIDWSISGNDNIGKNKLEITAETQTIYGVTFTVNKTAGTITANGRATAEAAFGCLVTLPAGRYLENGCPSGGSDNSYDAYIWNTATNTRTKKWDGETNTPSDYGRGVSQEVLLTEETRIRYTCRIRNGYNAQNVVFKPMVRPANTSADFEPYQIGVGQRTKNKLEITATSTTTRGVTFTVDKEAGTITTNGTASEYAYIDMVVDIPQGTYIFTTNISGTEHTNVILRKNDAGKTFIAILSSTDYSYTVDSGGIIIRTVVATGVSVSNEINTPMIRPADTSSDFVPYGYEIPLSVNSSPQDIYIGDTPLTTGETVSKTSTGVDIELVEGENTISTTLYNKPEMTIKYKYNGGN